MEGTGFGSTQTERDGKKLALAARTFEALEAKELTRLFQSLNIEPKGPESSFPEAKPEEPQEGIAESSLPIATQEELLDFGPFLEVCLNCV